MNLLTPEQADLLLDIVANGTHRPGLQPFKLPDARRVACAPPSPSRKPYEATWPKRRIRLPSLDTAAVRLRKNAYTQISRPWLLGQVDVVALSLRGERVPATHVHHIYGRTGALLCWEPGWLATTAEGDKWIHAHPDHARDKGWLCDHHLWNCEYLATS